MHESLFCVIFYRVSCTSTFSQKPKKRKNTLVVLVYFFREGSRQHFIIDFGFILVAFLEVFGLTNNKKQIPERDDKTALTKV